MFYRCLKCKKIWQYPIEKCPDCFSGLERLKSEKIRVIGISKVTIPTILHPKVPYFVLVLENENGNKWVQKSIKEYKIGDELSFLSQKELSSLNEKKAVAIWRIKYDILEAVEKVVELLGGAMRTPSSSSPSLHSEARWLKIDSQTKILILPTLIAPKHPYLAVNTNPKFLESLIQYLKEIGGDVKNIKVAAQSFDETPIEASAQKSQLLDVCLRNHLLPFDLAKGNFVKRGKNGFIFEISEEVFNADLVINLPILKLDSELGVRGALENTTKFLKAESYFSLKYLHSQEELLEKLPEVLPSYLTIADGLTIQKTNGLTTFLGLTLASFNPFNLDRVFAEIAMLRDLPEYLKKIKIEGIPIVGRKVGELQYEVEKI